jgi:hypothetical protein
LTSNFLPNHKRFTSYIVISELVKPMDRKIIYLLILFSIATSTLRAQELIEVDTSSFAQMEFEEVSFDFEELYQGEKVEYIFHYKNVGNIPLIFQNVLTTCGCTAPEWSKNPLQPGEKGELKVVFDSSAKIGRQNKVITIRSNAKSGDYQLRISGMVLLSKKRK